MKGLFYLDYKVINGYYKFELFEINDTQDKHHRLYHFPGII